MTDPNERPPLPLFIFVSVRGNMTSAVTTTAQDAQDEFDAAMDDWRFHYAHIWDAVDGTMTAQFIRPQEFAHNTAPAPTPVADTKEAYNWDDTKAAPAPDVEYCIQRFVSENNDYQIEHITAAQFADLDKSTDRKLIKEFDHFTIFENGRNGSRLTLIDDENATRYFDE